MLRLYGGTNLTPQALLSWALAKSFQIQELPEIGRTEHNKPYFPTLPGLHVNWSHSGPFVLCALGNAPVGVDIEVIRPRTASLPRYALTASEYAQYQANGADWPAFYALWTRKEAWCKYTGQGLRRQWGEDIPTGCFSAPTKAPPGGPPCAGRKHRPPPSNGRRKHHEALQTIL